MNDKRYAAISVSSNKNWGTTATILSHVMKSLLLLNAHFCCFSPSCLTI